MYVVGNGSGWSSGEVIVRCCSLFLGILLKDFWTLGRFLLFFNGFFGETFCGGPPSRFHSFGNSLTLVG
jgi:hypothetical protein